ncbi:tryptophan 7-halogenase [Simiduia sp. 21SJ11W-1]|uniref:tryptophan halogenase family protein n=1 Tax=Simiduia sp. 21SJ11W-1 TaxID=2909669 RepID=UPI00209F2886|nr:tryptophan halogenase family protein [Simiduia sp. 21SJ11W-1]UTA46609.1 tryptophan 7-halogenase [Simiduia sp. 21SJ11W-1]
MNSVAEHGLIKRVAIVGGGSSGWLAANHLAVALQGRGVDITLVESPDIKPIGVGEGTVPGIRKSLKKFGISEAEFLYHCDATFKQSIRFANWKKAEPGSDQSFYHHLFDFPFPFGEDLTPHWLNNTSSQYADTVSIQGALCETMRCPKSKGANEYEGEATYAYHFNAAKFSALLARNATQKLGVKYLQATVAKVNLDDTGAIASLGFASGDTEAFDFFVDCSGFHAVLLGGALDVPFESHADQLLVDTALVAQVPLEASDEIAPYTSATAHEAGWIWDIPLVNRRGTGFVYARDYMSDERAEELFRAYLGPAGIGLNFRKIPMNIGRRQVFWRRNCMALGLAQGFLEPLEATSILFTDFAASLLADRFPLHRSQLEALSERFNERTLYAWARMVDFIKLHYFLSDRDDSAFWEKNRDPQTCSQTLLARLALWQNYSPVATDFDSKFEVFDVENYLYVLYGMGFGTQAPQMGGERASRLAKQVAQLDRHRQHFVNHLPSHGEYLRAFRKAYENLGK